MTTQTNKILFVDDEQNILSSLRGLLIDEDWVCHFASSATEALEVLATEKIDLLVSDAMMPGTDGIGLLLEVKHRHPAVVRIFLTGHAKQAHVIKTLAEGYAQQIISKPWVDQEIKEIIRSALRQCHQQKKYGQKFQTLINSIQLLPALPENYSQVQACIAADEIDIEKISGIISQDVALSSTLLHWANSALFGQRFRVDSIKKAVIVLGTDIVANLILSEAVCRSVANSTQLIKGFDLQKFKIHSMATATIARRLIKSLHNSNTEIQDRALIAGLLHDMGKLIEASYFGKQFAAAFKYAKQHDCSLATAEEQTMGTNHAVLGGFLAEWWALPHFIGHSIQLHHEPKKSPIEPDIVHAVYMANLLSYRFGFGCNGEKVERPINPEIWKRFYLSEEGLEILQVETEELMQTLA